MRLRMECPLQVLFRLRGSVLTLSRRLRRHPVAERWYFLFACMFSLRPSIGQRAASFTRFGNRAPEIPRQRRFFPSARFTRGDMLYGRLPPRDADVLPLSILTVSFD